MIVRGVCNSFKAEILRGVHQEGDAYKIALFTSAANLSKATTAYDPAGEVPATGNYSPGGSLLNGFSVVLDGDVAILDWDVDPSWAGVTMSARGALIYNATRGNKAVGVLDFGQDITSTNGPFVVELPEPTVSKALVRLT